MINEHRVAARTLIIAAHDFLVEYIERGDWDVAHHELAAAAVDAVFSASFVDSYYKHDLLAAVHAKIKPGRAGYPDLGTMQTHLENEAAALAAGYPNLISMQMEQAQAEQHRPQLRIVRNDEAINEGEVTT